MGRTGRVLIAGPLAVFADGFRGELERLGYSPFTAEEQLRLMAHLSRWLEDGGLDVEELTAARAQEFLAYRRACGRPHRYSPRALTPVLGFLRRLGAAPRPVPAAIVTATERLLAAFEEHLLHDRGLSEFTVAGYRRVATLFVADCFPDGDLRLERLTAADVSAFMLARSACRSPGSLSTTVTGLRALLRFLHLRGTRRWRWRRPCRPPHSVAPRCHRRSPPRRWAGCWQAAIGATRSAGATTRS